MAATSPTPKRQLLAELITAFRSSASQDGAFENLAAERLGINRTDLDCLNAIENAGGLSAGQLAREVGITTGAVTGVVDRLERAGYAKRAADPGDRRRVKIEVTALFYSRAEEIWGPLAADWYSTLSRRFTMAEITEIVAFLQLTNEVGRRHLERLASEPIAPPARL
jgi:DNA-binding MarR family transcriptional regulator